MTHFISESFRIYAVTFMIAYAIMPFVGVAVSVYFTTYFYMFFAIIFLMLILLERRRVSFNEIVSLLVPFLMYGVLTYCTKTDDLLLWGYGFLIFMMPVIVGSYILLWHESDCKYYTRTIIICIIVTGITTSIQLIANPETSRWLATVANSNDQRLIMYSWKNVGGYEFIYTMVLMYPLLILAFKRGKISLFNSIVIALIVFFTLIFAEYTIALILFTATTAMFFIKKDLKLKDIIILLLVAVVFMLIFSSPISNLLNIIADNTKSVNISSRLHDLAGGTSGLQSSDDNRLSLYMTSLETFFNNHYGTFLNGGRGIGGHSFILDSLALYGIFGLIAIVLMYRKVYYLFYYKYRNEKDYGYIVWIFSQAILLSLINTGIWLDVLALYIPVVLCELYRGDKDEENSLDNKRSTQSC